MLYVLLLEAQVEGDLNQYRDDFDYKRDNDESTRDSLYDNIDGSIGLNYLIPP